MIALDPTALLATAKRAIKASVARRRELSAYARKNDRGAVLACGANAALDAHEVATALSEVLGKRRVKHGYVSRLAPCRPDVLVAYDDDAGLLIVWTSAAGTRAGRRIPWITLLEYDARDGDIGDAS